MSSVESGPMASEEPKSSFGTEEKKLKFYTAGEIHSSEKVGVMSFESSLDREV